MKSAFLRNPPEKERNRKENERGESKDGDGKKAEGGGKMFLRNFSCEIH